MTEAADKPICEYSGLRSVAGYQNDEYPETEGTLALCRDMTERRFNLVQMRAAFEYGKTLGKYDCYEDFIESLKK